MNSFSQKDRLHVSVILFWWPSIMPLDFITEVANDNAMTDVPQKPNFLLFWRVQVYLMTLAPKKKKKSEQAQMFLPSHFLLFSHKIPANLNLLYLHVIHIIYTTGCKQTLHKLWLPCAILLLAREKFFPFHSYLARNKNPFDVIFAFFTLLSKPKFCCLPLRQ